MSADLIRRLIGAWDCCGTCVGGVLAQHDREVEARALAGIQALAEQWNATPDYTPSDYDKGRVDQRHDMTGQLLALLPEPHSP